VKSAVRCVLRDSVSPWCSTRGREIGRALRSP